MISALFIYDMKGDVVVSKIYKDDVKRSMSDVFRVHVIAANSQRGSNQERIKNEVRSPVLTLGSTSFVYIKSGLIWICAVTRSNQDCSIIMEFLFNLTSLMKVLLNDNPSTVITSELITNNFAFVYELLDEVAEFGYPTNMEISYLKNYMLSASVKDKIFKIPSNGLGSVGSSSKQASKKLSTLNITWRRSDIRYRRNEIFVNVEEKVNVLMSPQSEVLRANVDGSINLKTHLSGMPECRFGFTEDNIFLNSMNHDRSLVPDAGSATLEDCKFHQCVELNKFDSERVIQFIPPDGEFQLMSYNCVLNLSLPFKVYPQIQEQGREKLQYKIRIRSLFPLKLSASDVYVRIPTPSGVNKTLFTVSAGKAKYHSEENCIVWKISRFFGGKEHYLNGEAQVADTVADMHSKSLMHWSRPPINMGFAIDMFSSSGLTVKFLKVLEPSNYRTIKWVKYSSIAGSYEIRY